MDNYDQRIEIKICGLTTADAAAECARLGADAVGLVFFPRSPRNVSPEQAREIVAALPSHVLPVGVLVNEDFSAIMDIVERSGIRGVQLHGQEPSDLVEQLKNEGLRVYKALFENGSPGTEKAGAYPAHAFLVECAKGSLPGGNAMAWDWGAVKDKSECRPLILAGGLSPDNVAEAIGQALPDAVDVSSGVESAPGIKDLARVERFIVEVKGCLISEVPLAGKKARIYRTLG